jgi:colanic acid biosynthesis glycosyl transferase WcaI
MSKVKTSQKMNLKTLWVISELYYPEETSTGYYLTRIAEGLADDFKVKVLCGQPNYSARGVKSPKREVRRNVEIFRAWGTTLDKNVIPFRILNMLTLGWSIFWKAFLKFGKNEQVLVVTTPPSLPFITAFAAVLRGARYYLLIHDNYPEILIAVGKAKENSFFVKVLDFFNRQLYKRAAKIIVVGRDMQELVERKTEGFAIPVEYIPNWAELEQVEPADRRSNPLLKELGLTDKFVFLYAGNMGHPNDLESILKCAEKLSEKPEFHFIFLGTGVKRKWLERESASRQLSNVTLLSPRPRSEQNIFLNACDVAIVSLVKKMKGVSMPSRTYNILAVGKPILALTEENSEVARVVLEDEIGWVVPPDDVQRLEKTILEIAMNRKQLESMQLKARNSAVTKYSVETAVRRYLEAID